MIEQPEGVRLANALGQQRDDWRARAERAEALLREYMALDCWKWNSYMNAYQCPYCLATAEIGQAHLANHAPDCLIARARALLAEGQP